MKKTLQIASLCLVLASCSVLDAGRLLTPDKPSLEVSAQIGKSNSQEKSTIKIQTGQDLKQDAEKITNDSNYVAERIENITQGMSGFELMAMIILAGLAIPTAGGVALGFKVVVVEAYKGLKVVLGDIASVITKPITFLFDKVIK